jgi:hypothetical protein
MLPNVDVEGARFTELAAPVAKPPSDAEPRLVVMADGSQRMLVGAGNGGGRHRL